MVFNSGYILKIMKGGYSMDNRIQTKCIQKFRDKQNKIYGYRLIDLNGHTQDVTPENLKRAISQGKVNVVNLTLTSNGRLIDTQEKQLQSKNLGKAPKKVETNSININALAKAFIKISVLLLDMGDSYSEVVDITCSKAGLTEDTSDISEFSELEALEEKAYRVLIKRKDVYINSIYESILDDNYEYYNIIRNEIYSQSAKGLNDSEVYKSICLIYKYFCNVDKNIAKGIKEKILSDAKLNNINAAKLGEAIGSRYYKYLDPDIFGTLTNDNFTVGHVITSTEKKQFKELKPFSYMFSKNISGPSLAVGPTFLFRSDDSGKIVVKVKMFRKGFITESVASVVDYIKDLRTFELDTHKSDDENAKIVAQYCNKIGLEIRAIARENPSLVSNLLLGAKPEKI
jgi:hypothetical protein